MQVPEQARADTEAGQGHHTQRHQDRCGHQLCSQEYIQ